MFPELTLGPLVLPTGGLTYILGAWVVLSLIERLARALRLPAEQVYNLAALSLASGFVGARIVFVALHWSAYEDSLVNIVWPLTSGFDFWGGIVIGLAAGFFYGRAKQLPPAATLDALAPGLIVALMVVSLADFLAGPGYGVQSNVPWAISVFGIERHPVQLYELLVGAAALAAWWRWLPLRRFAGQLFLVSIAVYSGGRLFVDAYRANAWLTPNGYHIVQIVSLMVLLATVYLLGRETVATQDEARSPMAAP
ncbi:MAG: prolipoprotein diacylglyceryl transferase [Candidatus Promineifilaceae bacterium]|nr:prolipoprotein diacylglyceryl transferase [Candidatus Promineifilaceae bacterium]